MRPNFLNFTLLLMCLFIVGGCDKAYFYMNAGTIDNPLDRKVIEPFIFDIQLSSADGKKITVDIFFSRISGEKYQEASVEFACPEFEVLVEGNKLKPVRVMCPSGKELLQLKRISADFATPNGRPKKAVVSVPTITVTAIDSQQKPIEMPKSTITFTLHEYDRSFGFR